MSTEQNSKKTDNNTGIILYKKNNIKIFNVRRTVSELEGIQKIDIVDIKPFDITKYPLLIKQYVCRYICNGGITT